MQRKEERGYYKGKHTSNEVFFILCEIHSIISVQYIVFSPNPASPWKSPIITYILTEGVYLIFNICLIGFYYIPGTITDSIGYNSEKDEQKSLPHRGEPEHRPVVYRDGQWLVGAMEKNEVGKRDLSGK